MAIDQRGNIAIHVVFQINFGKPVPVVSCSVHEPSALCANEVFDAALNADVGIVECAKL